MHSEPLLCQKSDHALEKAFSAGVLPVIRPGFRERHHLLQFREQHTEAGAHFRIVGQINIARTPVTQLSFILLYPAAGQCLIFVGLVPVPRGYLNALAE